MCHCAGRVGNLLRDALSFHAACCVRNATCDAFFCVAACCVRNLTCTSLLCHRASRVRHLLLAGFSYERARCVRNLLCRRYGNLTANSVRHLLVTDFRNHACACDGSFNHLWAPFAAANRAARTLDANRLCAAWVAWVNHAFLNNWAGNVLGFCYPFATAFLNRFALSHRLADGVAHVFVASL